jgi:flagellar biosynthesis protein FlhF
MSTTLAEPEARTYRGRTLEQLLPQIRTELGPDAIVVRQRDGLMGGIAGFFQQRFVEIEARPGHPRVDVYDEPPAADFAATLAAATDSAPFADALPVASNPRSAAPTADHAALATSLAAHGFSDAFAQALVADAAMHLLPLAPDGGLLAAARDALARRIPIAPLPTAPGRTVAFAGAAGAGKTRAVAALAAAYAQAGTPVRCLTLAPDDGGTELTRLLAPHGIEPQAVATPSAARTARDKAPDDALVVLDTPAVSPGDPNGIARLAARLAKLGLDETHLALPVTLSAAAAHEQLDKLAPLEPTAIALTHADATDHIGALVELAATTNTPLSFVADGQPLPRNLAPADAHRIAERLLR